MQMPAQIQQVLEIREKRGNSPCNECNATCCNGPGFAILENVLEIYKKYERNGLIRCDFEFEKDLTFNQFVFLYFDRPIINGNLILFFPKMITEHNSIMSIPPWNFWLAREYLMKRQKSYGCIFLNRKKTDDDFSYNYCILHNNPLFKTEITEMPIDCIYFQCAGLRNVTKPTAQESNLWFKVLNLYFPNSIERYKSLCPDDEG